MAIRSRSLVKKEVDRLFGEIKATARDGDNCEIPVVGGGFKWGLDPIAPLKEATRRELLAHEWFAVYGPADAPPFPYQHEIDSYRDARGLKGVVGFYARSLAGQDYDLRNHPSFDDFARGLMALAVEYGLWNLEKDDALIKRFPPLLLLGMTPSAYWAPPEEYEQIMSSHYRDLQRDLRRAA
jgi:hypothetical protein